MIISQKRREVWFEHVRRAQRAGVSVASYARSIQVPARVLYYWAGTLRRQGTVAAAAEGSNRAVSTFTAVRVEPHEPSHGAGGALRLSLPGGAELHWPSLPSPQWLAAFVRERVAHG